MPLSLSTDQQEKYERKEKDTKGRLGRYYCTLLVTYARLGAQPGEGSNCIGWPSTLLVAYDEKRRRNFGYSRLEIALTTDGGAQPPGLTAKDRRKKLPQG